MTRLERNLVLDRSPSIRTSRTLIALASMAQLDALKLREAPDVVGGCGDDYIDRMKQQLLACGGFGQGQAGGNACGPNGGAMVPGAGFNADPCNDRFIEVTQSGQQAGALVAAAAFSVVITLTTAFKPLLISIPDSIAASLKITTLNYQYDNMLRAAMTSGGAFSNKNTTGGYRRPGKLLFPGNTITIAGVAVAAIGADQLMIDVVGLSPN